MQFLPKSLFKTLLYKVDEAVRESLYKNDVFLSSRWGFLEKSIVRWSTHYKKYITLAFVLAILVVFNGILWQPWVKPYVMQYFSDWRGLLAWQGVFLGGQLTIVGVVYPLVVALIGILFQNKSAKRIIFPIYQKYSGFMFAGLSGLALSGFIVAGYFLRPSIEEQVYVVICITSALWLFSNLLLTAWFFVKTFKMLDEHSREVVVFRFCVQEAGESDIRRRIKQLLLASAVHHKLIVNPDENVIEVMARKYSNDNYQEITCQVKRKEGVKDVRLWLLNAAIWLQVWLLKLKKLNGGKLVVQPHLASRAGDAFVVAQYSGFEINFLVKVLIKLSFSFQKESQQVDIGLSTVLHSFIGPANDALRQGDAKGFSDAVDNLASWHTEIAQALSFKNDDGDLDNWLLLPARGILGRTYLYEFLGEYYRLAREAVERIPDNSRFYTDMLHLHRRIFSSRDFLHEQEMRLLIRGSYSMWYLLVEWRSYNSESRDLRIANKYEDILHDFVGAWESWLVHIEPRLKRTGDINKAYPAFITHLEFTASTAISALRFNNFEAAGWGIDMLINWLEKLSGGELRSAEYQWRAVLVNHCLLSLEPKHEIWQLILRENDYNLAFDLCFKNAHLDLRVITACYMLLKPGDDSPELLIKYVKALLPGSRIHPTVSVSSRHSISNAGDLLGAYIRHRDYRHDDEEGTYGNWLSSILESFGRIYEERRVSGRIYSGWGANDAQSMNSAYVEIAISLSTTRWGLPNDWEEAIMSGFFGHRDREAIIADLRNWLEIANADNNYILVEPDKLESYKTNFIESVEGVIQKIGDALRLSVANADIDSDRLVHFGNVSSVAFRSDKNPLFPLTLFKHLDRDADIEDSCSFAAGISNYLKKGVALGVEINRAINEDEWMAGCISNDLKLNILRALLRYPNTASYEYTDLNNLISDICGLSKSMACPVLFVGNKQLKNMLRRSPYDPEIAERHDISRQDGFDNEYICHIGRCEVYSLSFSDVDFCILTTKELFNTVSFRQIDEGRYVNVDFELNDGSDTTGKLTLKYWMKVDLTENTSCIKLTLDISDAD